MLTEFQKKKGKNNKGETLFEETMDDIFLKNICDSMLDKKKENYTKARSQRKHHIARGKKEKRKNYHQISNKK